MYNSNGYSLSDIAAATGGNENGIFGGNGSWILVLIILIAIFGGWGNGNGGFGGRGSSVYEGYVLSNDQAQISRQIADTTAMTERKLDSVTNGLCDGFYTTAQQINGLGTSILTSTNAIQSQLAQCCCDNRAAISDVKYTIGSTGSAIDRSIAEGFCQTNFNAATNTRDIVDTQNAGTQAILAKLNDMETNRLREKLEAERDAKYALQGQLDRAQLRTQIVDDVRPCPRPAYITCSPFGCNCQQNVYGYGYPYGTTIA